MSRSLRPVAIDSTHRVILPKAVLDALDVKPGDHLAFSIDRDAIRLHRVRWEIVRSSTSKAAHEKPEKTRAE